MHERFGFGTEPAVFREGQVPLFSAFAEFNAGKMSVKPPAAFLSEPVPYGVEHRGKIRLGRQAAQGAGIEVPEIDAGQEPFVDPAEKQHLIEIPELVLCVALGWYTIAIITVAFWIPHRASSAGVRKSAQTLIGVWKGASILTVCRATAPKPMRPTG